MTLSEMQATSRQKNETGQNRLLVAHTLNMWHVCCSDHSTIRVYAQQPGVYMEFKHPFPSALCFDPERGSLLGNVVPSVTRLTAHAPPGMVLVPDGMRMGSYMAAGNTLLHLDAGSVALVERVQDLHKPVFVVRARDTACVFELSSAPSNGGEVEWKAHEELDKLRIDH